MGIVALPSTSILDSSAPGRTLLTAASASAQRSLLGLGTSDSPTFLAQTLSGQSLTGSQSTSLLNLSTTWNTTGTPTAILLNVTDTASNASSLLMNLQVGGVNRFGINKSGVLTLNNLTTFTSTSAEDFTTSSSAAYQRVRAYSFWASKIGRAHV